jgi:Domain of unknown function (DUF4388)
MALSGELSDLSLSELIEFFCNQRKTGRLKVIYPNLPGYFYIQAGALVDARIGTLSGIDAVYYALTLPNASFTFDMEIEVEQRTIHQPWTQVVLEGLRRMDEGISPEPPLNKEELPDEHDLEVAFDSVIAQGDQDPAAGPMAMTLESMAGGRGSKRRMVFGALAMLVLGIVAASIILTNRFASAETTALIPPVAVRDAAGNSANTPEDGASTAQQIAETEPSNQAALEGSAANDAAAQREREARERERRRAAEERADARTATDAQTAPSTTTAEAVKKPDAPKAGPKTVTVQVTYDEAGRVTQASGSDATALRIARQKRFPSGKAGTTTVTIPVN